MNSKKVSRDEVEEMADAMLGAGFWVAGVGHFDISRDELVNILMIAINRDDREKCLDKYYTTLHDRVFGKNYFYERVKEQYEFNRSKKK